MPYFCATCGMETDDIHFHMGLRHPQHTPIKIYKEPKYKVGQITNVFGTIIISLSVGETLVGRMYNKTFERHGFFNI